MAFQRYTQRDGRWLEVEAILVEVRETAITKEDAIQSINEKLERDDCVRLLLLQLCDNEITVDEVTQQLLAAVTLTSLEGGEPAPIDEEAVVSLLSQRLRRAQVSRRSFQIKQAIGLRDPVAEVVDGVETGTISVEAAVDRLRD